jgi:energy-converting hydrogenase A subunit M
MTLCLLLDVISTQRKDLALVQKDDLRYTVPAGPPFFM